MRRATPWIVLIGTCVLLVMCMGALLPGAELVFTLTFGWLPFLRRVGGQLTVRWDLVISASVYVTVFFIGSHFFLRWLHREIYKAENRVPWRWRATLGLVALVIVLFAAGTAVVEIVHQTTWLARSPEPMYRRSPRGYRFMCAGNLKVISLALREYADCHDGKLPDDFSELALNSDLSSTLFICPSSEDHVDVNASSPPEVAEALRKPHHCSYVYLGKGLSGSIDDKTVIAVDLWDNHAGEGINALKMDGSVIWLDRPKAEALLLSLGFERQPKHISPR